MRSDQFRSMAVALGVAVQGLEPAEVEAALGRALRQAGHSFLWVVDDLASGLDALGVRAWFAPDPLGEEHPATLTATGNLAETLCAQGELGGARALQQGVLAVSRRVLGEEHPATSISAWNLLNTLWKLEETNRAVILLQHHLRWLLDRDPNSLRGCEKTPPACSPV